MNPTSDENAIVWFVNHVCLHFILLFTISAEFTIPYPSAFALFPIVSDCQVTIVVAEVSPANINTNQPPICLYRYMEKLLHCLLLVRELFP